MGEDPLEGLGDIFRDGVQRRTPDGLVALLQVSTFLLGGFGLAIVLKNVSQLVGYGLIVQRGRTAVGHDQNTHRTGFHTSLTLAYSQYSFHGAPGRFSNLKVDFNPVFQGLEGSEDLGQGNSFHVGAKIAGTYKFNFGELHCHIVTHGALRDQDDSLGPFFPNVLNHG